MDEKQKQRALNHQQALIHLLKGRIEYFFMIHQYKLNGYNIVLDINSGSIHVPDPLAYEAIRLIDESGGQKSDAEIGRELWEQFASEGVTREEIQETLSDISELRAEGKLFSEETFADRAQKAQYSHQGTLSSGRAYLQSQLQLLFCCAGEFPRAARIDVF